MAEKVYFIDLRATFQEGLNKKIERLLDTAGLGDVITESDLTAVKLHFGEQGNTAFIKPVHVRHVVEKIVEKGGSPFLTDTNTLYKGTRGNTPDHLRTAVRNGFAYSVTEAPVVIADGLRGRNSVSIALKGKHYQEVHIGADIFHADSMVVLSHFKGHELSGFGGALKNLGMGCASRQGKLAQHSTVSPRIVRKKCIGCALCSDHCPAEAIKIVEKKAKLNPDACIGCGDCIVVCPKDAVQVKWNQSVPVFLESMMEYARGAIYGKEKRTLYVNFITSVSPKCDCIDHNDAPIVRDIGIVASKDPVAIDQASVDLVNSEHALAGTCLSVNMGPGEDKFKGLYPNVDWPIQLEYAEELGIGTREYELVKLTSIGLKEKQD